MSVNPTVPEPPPKIFTAEDAEKQAPPPSYDSLFKKIRKAKEDSTKKTELCKSVTCALTGSALVNVIGVLVLGAFITAIVMSAIYLYDCPVRHQVAIYLMTAGSVGTVFVLLEGADRINENKMKKDNKAPSPEYQKRRKNVACVKTMFIMFFLFWFISGNVTVYGLKNDWVSWPPTSENYCDPTLYYFAFWFITSHYILIGIIILASILVSVVA